MRSKLFGLAVVVLAGVPVAPTLAQEAPDQQLEQPQAPSQLPTLPPEERGRVPGTVAVLNALDKITGRVSFIEAALDTPVRFEALEITVRACHATPPEEAPESTAFLEIRDIGPDAAVEEPIFSGWMFASSPAVSALEHPVYDVWVINCKISAPDKSGGSSEKSAD